MSDSRRINTVNSSVLIENQEFLSAESKLKELDERLVKAESMVSVSDVFTTIDDIAQRITQVPALMGSFPYLILMLNNWVSFGVDLSRSLDKLDFPHRITYLHLEENAQDRLGEPQVIAPIPKDLTNHTVIIAADVDENSPIAAKSIALCEARGSKAIFTAFKASLTKSVKQPVESKDIVLDFAVNEQPGLTRQTSVTKIQEIQQEVAKFQAIATRAQIETAVDDVALQIVRTPALMGVKPYLIYVMNGGIYFGVDLSRSLKKLGYAHHQTYMHLGSYGNKYEGGTLEVIANIPSAVDLNDQTVIIAEDVLDRGVTAAKTIELCLARGAKAVYTAFLAHKPNKRLPEHQDIVPNFVGFTCDDRYLLGEGLDVQGAYRAYQGGGLFAFDPHADKQPVPVKLESLALEVFCGSFSNL